MEMVMQLMNILKKSILCLLYIFLFRKNYQFLLINFVARTTKYMFYPQV